MTHSRPPGPRREALAAEGLTLPLDRLPSGAGLVHTAFGEGPEIWVLPAGADPDHAIIDLAARRVPGARLLVDAAGAPATPATVTRLGLVPVLKLPRL